MLDELGIFTLESITGVYFGDYATAELMEDVQRYMPAISNGLLSLPVRFPWPLNKLTVFSFGKSMDAREAFAGVIRRVLNERRADLLSAGVGGNGTGGKSAEVLDSLIEIQQRENGSEDGQGGTFDDHFIVDMVRNRLEDWSTFCAILEDLCAVLECCKPVVHLPCEFPGATVGRHLRGSCVVPYR